jgi:hypothetical protein
MSIPASTSRATAAEISPAPDSCGGILNALALRGGDGTAVAVSTYRQLQFSAARASGRYGFDNWLRAFNDPTTISALWMSFLLAVARLSSRDHMA